MCQNSDRGFGWLEPRANTLAPEPTGEALNYLYIARELVAQGETRTPL